MVSSDSAHTVRVAPASRAYDVVVAPAALRSLGIHLRRVAPSRRAHLIADATLPQATIAAAKASLTSAGFAVTTSTATATEQHKSLDSAARLLQSLLASKHERNDPVISLGGGIVTDLAGFVAATYRRGVPVIHCPTTLLAMVDAAVGGKTAVNLQLPDANPGELAKNMVGVFWQPHLVLCDTTTLNSLPKRQLRAGMAECLKHALLAAGLPEGRGRDTSLWQWTLDRLDACLRLDAAPLTELITRNISIKAAVVSQDEREEAPSASGGRALLNLGHTYAHAIETLAGLTPVAPAPEHEEPAPPPRHFQLHHGEAVALGLIAAANASLRLNTLNKHDADAVRQAVERTGLPTRLRGLPPNEALITRMQSDKKSAAGNLRLILLHALGQARVTENPPPAVINAGWDAIRA